MGACRLSRLEHASGHEGVSMPTITVTINAPNTTIDRKLTLPDDDAADTLALNIWQYAKTQGAKFQKADTTKEA